MFLNPDTGWIVGFAIVLAAMAIRSILVMGSVYAFVRASSFAKRRRIYSFAFADGQLISELKAGLLVLAFDAAVITAVQKLGWIHFSEGGVTATLITVVVLTLWLEIWFYVSHRALHHKSLFWIHRQHHTAKVTEPLTSLSFSLGERAILDGGVLLFAWAMAFVLPITIQGLILTVMINYIFNVVAHANTEFMPRFFVHNPIGRMFITPTFHSMHHARFKGHYGLYTTILDRVFGTAHPDYEEVYEHAVHNDPLTRPGQNFLNRQVRGRAPGPASEEASSGQRTTAATGQLQR